MSARIAGSGELAQQGAMRARIGASAAGATPSPVDHFSGAAYAVDPVTQDGRRPRRSQATELIELSSELDLWHADDEPYACVEVEGHRETWPLRSRTMRVLLAHRYYLAHRRAPGRQAIEDALAVLAGRALHDGDRRHIHVRIAGEGPAIYIDLADAGWRAIEIDAAGWRIVEHPPVYFARRRGMLALPAPEIGGTLADLTPYLPVRDERDRRAIIAWLVQAYRPSGPYPVIVFAGEQGTGKSTLARMLRALVDPSVAPIRTVPRDERDLLLAARNGWVVTLDNLSGAQPWLSDALCRLSTGGGLSTRELYSDSEELLIDVQRPACCNGIDAIATRPDLADRAIVVTLEPIADTARRPEGELMAMFHSAAPRIIGALCDIVSCALRRLPTTRLERLPRMADHALWIEAASPALGWPSGEYAADYIRARDEVVGQALDDSALGVGLLALLERGPWSGTASELLAVLLAPQPAQLRGWPTSPRALANAIARIAPALRARGYGVEQSRTHGGRRTYRLSHLGHSSDVPSPPSPTVTCVLVAGDDGDATG